MKVAPKQRETEMGWESLRPCGKGGKSCVPWQRVKRFPSPPHSPLGGARLLCETTPTLPPSPLFRNARLSLEATPILSSPLPMDARFYT